MRQLRYSVASSLDGYIAGPNGEFDWIVIDPEIDFAAMYAAFGGLVMGRRSFDVFMSTGGAPDRSLPTYVYSRTLPEGERNGVTFVRDAVPHVRGLKSGVGKPLWLWGGGNLFRELAQAGRSWHLQGPGSRCA
jgi:dihydrofolate reductase